MLFFSLRSGFSFFLFLAFTMAALILTAHRVSRLPRMVCCCRLLQRIIGQCFELLLAGGADVNAKNGDELTALQAIQATVQEAAEEDGDDDPQEEAEREAMKQILLRYAPELAVAAAPVAAAAAGGQEEEEEEEEEAAAAAAAVVGPDGAAVEAGPPGGGNVEGEEAEESKAPVQAPEPQGEEQEAKGANDA